MKVTYQEFKSSPALQRYVDTYWLLSFKVLPASIRLVSIASRIVWSKL